MIWLFAILLLAGLAWWPFEAERRRRVIGEAERRTAPGKFAALSQGITHYRWLGPVRGPVVVAIHGLTTPSPVWADVGDGLGRIGYRVLVYDLYGRGLSDAPPGAQDAAFLDTQLTDLLADQGLGQELTLIGYSMGAAIATGFAARYPERVKRLILLAPAGVGHAETALARFIRRTPLLGDWLHLLLFGWMLRKTIAPGPLAAVQLAELVRQGFSPAVLASQRGVLQDPQEALHRAVGRADIPVVAIWGDKDEVVPLRGMGDLVQWNRSIRQEVVAGAGHGLPYTHGAAVIAVLTDVLREV